MTRLEYENINDVIFKAGKLRVSISLKVNSKSTNGTLYSGFYTNRYNSNKYSDRPQLEGLVMDIGEYLQFEYRDFSNQERAINESVVVSYNKFLEVRDFFTKALNFLLENEKTIYQEDQTIHPDYNNFYFASEPLNYRNNDPLQLGMFPTFTVSNSNTMQGMLMRSVVFCVGNMNYPVEMSLDGFLNLCERVISLTADSTAFKQVCQNTLNSALLVKLLEGGGVPTANPVNSVPQSRTHTPNPAGRTSIGGGFTRAAQQPTGLTSRPAMPTRTGSLGSTNSQPGATPGGFTRGTMPTPNPTATLATSDTPTVPKSVEIEDVKLDDLVVPFEPSEATAGQTPPAEGSLAESIINGMEDIDVMDDLSEI